MKIALSLSAFLLCAATCTMAAEPAAPPPSLTLTGIVLETMDSGGYTYLRLKLASGGESWAAISQTPVAKGQTVTVVDAMSMDGFESKTLNRRFDKIVFGELKGSASPAAAPSGSSTSPHPAMGASADVGDVNVPKATGADARRIAEVFAQKATLVGKPVEIRGKVVKYTAGVMGSNWIHLRDGSGAADKNDNDITVTTKGETALGKTVVVRGKVAIDRDFGMGYRYPVLIEDATLLP